MIDLKLNDIYEFDRSDKLFFEYLHLALENNYQFPNHAYAYFILMHLCANIDYLSRNHDFKLETPVSIENIEYNASVTYSRITDIFEFPQIKNFFESEYVYIHTSDVLDIIYFGQKLTPEEYVRHIKDCEKRINELNLDIKFPEIR